MQGSARPNLSIQLDAPSVLPQDIQKRLDKHRGLFQKATSLEQVMLDESVLGIANDLDSHLHGHRIRAYHCTKERTRGFFAARGLRLTVVQSHQVEFLADHGSLFTAAEVREMQAAWHDYFVMGRQAKLRDGVVWCCLTRSLALSHGTASFFECFGGEAIYMPLKEHPTIGPKLQSIGSPVVVEFSVPYEELSSFQDLSYVPISRHHQTVRADAQSYEAEARVRRAIQPHEILSVTPLDEFQAAHRVSGLGTRSVTP